MRIKIDYKASKKVDGLTTEEPVPGVIFTEIPDDKFNDESFIKEKLKEETEDPQAELIGYESE
ncbi:hypothetical protein [Alkalicoccus daliensis]|uniref:Uncharacterized protein n=1 Tax=Alkalicoccus daliensis TaxID=745820 RepID=A0A1H0GXT6_9BACI|nr:hypothetical protein [Alkalicoccus daliensis]SDO11668.1 hypothetical protein SAMN04488053_10783 [Alkalicoccus daliensis]